jgi:hypothetical protein
MPPSVQPPFVNYPGISVTEGAMGKDGERRNPGLRYPHQTIAGGAAE